MIIRFDQFNEKLRADTYKSAADKLKKLGHVGRAKKLENHMNRNLTDHVFNFWLFSTEFIPSSNPMTVPHRYKCSKVNDMPIQGKLKISFDPIYFQDMIEYETDRPLSLSIFMKFDKSKLDKKTLEFIDDYIIGDNTIDIFSIQPTIGSGKLNPQDLNNSNIDQLHGEFMGKFADRKSAIELKKALKNTLFNKIPQYDVGYVDEHTEEMITLSDCIRDNLMKVYQNATLEDIHEVYYKICNINTNLLYTEDGVW